MFFNTSTEIVFLFGIYIVQYVRCIPSYIYIFLWTVIPNVKEEDNYVSIPNRIKKFQNVCPK